MADWVKALQENIIRWRAHPDKFVREAFGVTPDPWQDEVLIAFSSNQRIAMKSSKGPGKTSTIAWLCWNFMLCYPNPKIAATSITGDNLDDGLWTEMAKWQDKCPLLKELFTWQKTRIFAKSSPETWWMSARQWPRSASAQQQADTLAGLHADYIMFVLDESGGIPDAVMVSAEAALSTGIVCRIVQAGNPTNREGPLWRACTTERNLWKVVEVTSDPDDPMRSPRVSKQWAQEQIQKYGRENPWVLVNVFGQFPPGSINALIGPDEVSAATKRFYREYEYAHAPKILGMDCARFGDDSSIIAPRQGLVAFPMIQMRNSDSFQLAGALVRKWNDWDADAAFVDDTGGYGAGVIDAAKQLGRSPIGVQYAGSPHDPRYFNKRAEMYFQCVEWIKNGGAIPDVPELAAALTRTTYSFKGDRLLLEPKDQVKEKLGYSPDHADALISTFSEPIVPQRRTGTKSSRHMAEYDPYEDEFKVGIT